MDEKSIDFDKVFVVKTSKSEIPIDADELEKVINAIGSGDVVILKQGIFNPSFFDTIVQDKKRVVEIKEMIHSVDRSNKMVGMRAGDHEFEEQKYDESMLKLPDLFQEVRAKLATSNGKEELEDGN